MKLHLIILTFNTTSLSVLRIIFPPSKSLDYSAGKYKRENIVVTRNTFTCIVLLTK